MATRFFHNYLREAIKRKDVHAVYDLFYQYRSLASDLMDRPDDLRTLGKRFRHYAEQAGSQGMAFALQIAGFDLGWVVLEAATHASPATEDLLGEVLALRHLVGQAPQAMLVKAKIILGAGLLERNQPALAQRVADNLADLAVGLVAQTAADLRDMQERAFWEVTESPGQPGVGIC